MFGSGSRKPDRVFMLKGHFDETEKDGLFLLGGFLGNCDQWDALEKMWDNIRQGRNIHLSEMRINTSTTQLLRNLAPLPYAAGLTPYYVSIKLADYEDMLTPVGAKLAYKPYPNCLSVLLSLVNKEATKEEQIKFAFERNDLYDAHACAIFEEAEEAVLNSKGEPRYPSWEFFAKGVCALCQPADYFCYAQRERMKDPASDEAIWSAPILDANPGKVIKWEFTRHQIRWLIGNMLAGEIDHGDIMRDYLREIRRMRHPKREG
jgi:hypothetical protein